MKKRRCSATRRHDEQRAFWIAAMLATATGANAQPSWRGDMETNDLEQWSYLLNPAGLSVVEHPVLGGSHAAKVEIDASHRWSNGLNRVELQRKPPLSLVGEGREVYFGWSIYLPRALSDVDHQLGYWETSQTYQQVMSVHARGQDLSFETNEPRRTLWRGPDLLTPERWHRLVFHVVWANTSDRGRVSLWFDGDEVVDDAHARTYWDEPAFIQLGILRDPSDTRETLFVDEALEGARFEDVARTVLTTAPQRPSAMPQRPNAMPQPRGPGATTSASSGCSVHSATHPSMARTQRWFEGTTLAVLLTLRLRRVRRAAPSVEQRPRTR